MTREDEISFWWEMYAAAHAMGMREETKKILREIIRVRRGTPEKTLAPSRHVRKRLKRRRSIIK